jgi:hypothetical protein
VRRYQKTIMVMSLTTCFILAAIAPIDPIRAAGEKTALSQEGGRDPFLLPPGVHLLSKIGTASGRTGGRSGNIPFSSFMLTAILISDHARLALIDRHIVTVGDSIHGEKVLEIKTDRVTLGKGEQKRTLLLAQSPVRLTVEQNPPPNPPTEKGGRTLLEITVDSPRNQTVHQTPPEGANPAVEPFDPELRGTDGPEYVEGQEGIISNGEKEEVKGEYR